MTFIFYGWGWRKSRLSHFSLRGRLYSNPSSLVPPFIPMPDSMTDLCERKEEVWARNGRPNFDRQSDFLGSLTCWVLNKLRHGTDGFTSPPKEDMLWIFFARKVRRLRPGSNPRLWVPEASMLTTRPPKPL
jgi:hypothetical protein